MKTINTSDILYEDNHLLVLNKEPGLLTQPVPNDNRDSLEEMAKAYIKEKYNKPGKVFLNAVHRIDRQVSGLVIFARTDKGLSRLNQAMRDKRITKIYHALVEGEIHNLTGQATQLKNHISHKDYFASVTSKKQADSREATLTYSVLRYAQGISLLEVHLDTGRYHQIRAQLAFAGHPVVGDKKYGASSDFGPDAAIGLHSRQCSFPHPVRQEKLDLIASYPPSWPEKSKELLS